jgi:protein-disulfide isomerase
MKYLYIALWVVVGLFGLYSVTGILFLKWSTYQVENPKAAFQIIENDRHEITIVDFTNYRCGYCKQMHSTINELLSLQKNIRYIPRPILFGTNPEKEDFQEQKPFPLEQLVMAAGLQGKFFEMHNIFMEYPDGIIPEDLIKETAELYGIDYDQMLIDAQSEKVKKYLDDNMTDMVGYKIQIMPSYIINGNIYRAGDTLPTLQQLLSIIEAEK